MSPSETVSGSVDTLADKIQREADLFASLGKNIGAGISQAVNDAWSKPHQTADLIGKSIVFGAGLAVIAKNPAILGEAIEPALRCGIKYGGTVGAGLTVMDLTMRTAAPIASTWNSAENLQSNKILLGDRLGSATVDYTLMGAGGLLGAKYGCGFLKGGAELLTQLHPNSNLRFAYSHAGSTKENFSLLDKELCAPLENTNVLYNASSSRSNPLRVVLTGKTHLTRPEAATNTQGGDICVFPAHTGKPYLESRLILKDSNGETLSKLPKFDTKDVVRDHFWANSKEEMAQKMEALSEYLTALAGKTAIWRPSRHHPIPNDDSNTWGMIRMLSPEWLNAAAPTNRAKIRLSGGVSDTALVKPKEGTLILEARLDEKGLLNKKKEHGAQSGEFELSVYDDFLQLQKFNLWRELHHHSKHPNPEELHAFANKTEMQKKGRFIIDFLKTIDSRKVKDKIAVWNYEKHRFELPN